MKTPAILIIAAILGCGKAAAFDLTVEAAETGRPEWQLFHAELERKVELQVQEAKRDVEFRKKNDIQLPQRYSFSRGSRQSIPESSGVSPNAMVDGPTLRWLKLAVRQPIPSESRLRAIFREERVPEDLIYVGLVESGYNNNAVSSAGAVGTWQFIDTTGHRYGLKQGKKGDDRRDLVKSTRAAARYLRDLFDLLGDWNLALAGYNSGENRVLQAMRKAATKDFWALRHLLPSETAEYVPRVLAAISLARGVRPDDTQSLASLTDAQ